MKKKEKDSIRITKADDVLDSLSLWLNKVLRTEKMIDDKKNNVYFWLFKLIFLFLYLAIIDCLFDALRDFGVSLIYVLAVSLRTILASIFAFSVEFCKELVMLYLLFKNLKIFMNSSYYKRLYSRDNKMKDGKEKFFRIAYNVLKYLSVPFLALVGAIATFMIILIIIFVYMCAAGVYVVSPILITLSIFAICYVLFRSIQNKFFDRETAVTNKTWGFVLGVLLISICLFGYEISGYEYNSGLPENFSLVNKVLEFKLDDAEEVYIKSGSKYNNVSILKDDSLENKIRVELDYYETANTFYTTYLNDDDKLLLRFDSTLNYSKLDMKDVLKLGVESARKQTLYNYNLFKYPVIRIYVSGENESKVKLVEYDKPIRGYENK